MKFAIVNGSKQAPSPKVKGICQYCGKPTVSKCGVKVRWHWAHARKESCDPWWDNESQWHRDWKSHWAFENQEVVAFDETGEKHIADVKSPNGTVIEFQNSPMSQKELQSREQFYGDMVWVVNGRNLAKNMKLRAALPDPTHESMADIGVQNTNHKTHFIYYHISEYQPDELIEIHSSDKIEHLINDTHAGHFFYEWKRPKHVWLNATKPVYLDFGKDILWKLMRFNDYSSFCIQAHRKKEFLERYERCCVT
ncbi:hypothetical protein L4D77_28445 [Photobacterium frigidiphilum]|uniref:competence protein CoiA family protein n=1 Tax=Photobacterium frigidiphilum TaxID=264736 RepID=UPI003D0E2C44